MAQTETNIVVPPKTSDNLLFLDQTQKDVIRVMNSANGSIAKALMAPVKDFVAWLGLDLEKGEDWSRVVSARTVIRNLVNAQVDVNNSTALETNSNVIQGNF